MSENTSDYLDTYNVGLAALNREYPDIELNSHPNGAGLIPTLGDEEISPILASLVSTSVSTEVDRAVRTYAVKLHQLIQDFLTARRLDQSESSLGFFQQTPMAWSDEK